MKSINGINISSIVNIKEVFSEDLISSLICQKCSKLSFPPCLCSNCNHSYCYNCLLLNKLLCPICKGKLVFFPEDIKSLYKELLIKCNENKCGELLRLNQLDDHYKNSIRHNYSIINFQGINTKQYEVSIFIKLKQNDIIQSYFYNEEQFDTDTNDF